MASTGSDIPASAMSNAQQLSGHDPVHDENPPQKASTPHEHPPFNFEPVELDDLSGNREEAQPILSTPAPTNMASTDGIMNTTNLPESHSLSSPTPNPLADPSQPTDKTPSPSDATTQAPPISTGFVVPTSSLPVPQQEHDIGRTETTPAADTETADAETANAEAAEPNADTASADVTSTVLFLTLLLTSNARHVFTLDDKYLKSRGVVVKNDDPLNLSVYTLKELIWRDWRRDWEARPTSPTSIRLIHFGKLLEDKAYLRDTKVGNGDKEHVLHLSVKPQDFVDEEDARIAKSMSRSGDDGERSHGCRCVIL